MHWLQNYKSIVDLNLRKALKNKPMLHFIRVGQKLGVTEAPLLYLADHFPKNIF
jgi:hypothetical protein